MLNPCSANIWYEYFPFVQMPVHVISINVFLWLYIVHWLPKPLVMLFSQSLIPTVHVLFTCCNCNVKVVEGTLTLDTLQFILFNLHIHVSFVSTCTLIVYMCRTRQSQTVAYNGITVYFIPWKDWSSLYYLVWWFKRSKH